MCESWKISHRPPITHIKIGVDVLEMEEILMMCLLCFSNLFQRKKVEHYWKKFYRRKFPNTDDSRDTTFTAAKAMLPWTRRFSYTQVVLCMLLPSDSPCIFSTSWPFYFIMFWVLKNIRNILTHWNRVILLLEGPLHVKKYFMFSPMKLVEISHQPYVRTCLFCRDSTQAWNQPRFGLGWSRAITQSMLD
jgi:hypothetical protein